MKKRVTVILSKKNPPLVIFGNPKGVISRDVKAIVYRHAKTGELMVHGFGPDGEQIELESSRGTLTIRGLTTTKTNTLASSVDGGRSVVLHNGKGLPIVGEFPE